MIDHSHQEDPERRIEGATRSVRPEGLTGFWTGVFDLEVRDAEATPFHAFLCEQDGLLTGEMIEDNAFSPEPLPQLFASVEGWRDGREIEFVKTYEDAVGAGFSLRFEGVADEAGAKIEGVWTQLDARRRSGPFVMNRRPRSASEDETSERF